MKANSSMHPWSWRKAIAKSALRSTTKLVLYTLANYMNEHGGGCFPSIETISDDASLTKKSVIDHISFAVEDGFLEVYDAGLGKQNWRRNGYLPKYPSGPNAEIGLEIDAKEGGVRRTPQDVEQNQNTEGGYFPTPPQGKEPLEGGESVTPPSDKVVYVVPEGGVNDDRKVVYDVHPNTPSKHSTEGEDARAHISTREEPPSSDQAVVLDKTYYISLERRKRSGEKLEPEQLEYIRRYEEQQSGLARKKAGSTSSAMSASPPTQRPLIESQIKPELSEFMAKVRSQIGEVVRKAWFDGIGFDGVENGSVRLSFPSLFVKSHIVSHHREALFAAAKQIWPEASLELRVR
jgi:hypothetical protein